MHHSALTQPRLLVYTEFLAKVERALRVDIRETEYTRKLVEELIRSHEIDITRHRFILGVVNLGIG